MQKFALLTLAPAEDFNRTCIFDWKTFLLLLATSLSMQSMSEAQATGADGANAGAASLVQGAKREGREGSAKVNKALRDPRPGLLPNLTPKGCALAEEGPKETESEREAEASD